MNPNGRGALVTAVIAGAMGVTGVAFGIALGVAGFGTSAPGQAASPVESTTAHAAESSPVTAEAVVDPEWSVNASGETYGPVGKYGHEPDLIEAHGEDGAFGYVKVSDLDPALAASPEGAARANAVAERAFSIPLYEADGETVIGNFIVNDGATTETK